MGFFTGAYSFCGGDLLRLAFGGVGFLVGPPALLGVGGACQLAGLAGGRGWDFDFCPGFPALLGVGGAFQLAGRGGGCGRGFVFGFPALFGVGGACRLAGRAGGCGGGFGLTEFFEGGGVNTKGFGGGTLFFICEGSNLGG